MAVTRDEMKDAAARGALAYVDTAAPLGVGTGTTVGHFIDLLGSSGRLPREAVATSIETKMRLEAIGVTVIPLPEVGHPTVYIDGADEIDPAGRMIKGGGGAHAAEKAVASASRLFVCIVDATKVVRRLGERAPVPLEVLPEAAELVRDAVHALGGVATERTGRRADSGNLLFDCVGLDLTAPESLEERLDAIPGVVECGVFARRRADVVIVGEPDGSVRTWIPGIGAG
jgi:ribose 5-phosphate isomerase A